jgi:hypothetical protein
MQSLDLSSWTGAMPSLSIRQLALATKCLQSIPQSVAGFMVSGSTRVSTSKHLVWLLLSVLSTRSKLWVCGCSSTVDSATHLNLTLATNTGGGLRGRSSTMDSVQSLDLDNMYVCCLVISHR